MAVGMRLVEKSCPDAVVTNALVVAGRSTIAGILLLAELDTFFPCNQLRLL